MLASAKAGEQLLLQKQLYSRSCQVSFRAGGRVHHGLKGGFSDEPAEDTVDLSS